jgi:hypothetical protein
MDGVLKEEIHGPKPSATQYLDDTLLSTEEFEEHLFVLDRVLAKLVAIDLKLCPSKCLFGASQTEHLGHVVMHNKLLPAPEKVRAITDLIQPANVLEVRSFLQLAGYYRNFIKDFSKIARPLHELTTDGCVFEWTKHAQVSMDLIKQAICDAQGLVRPNFNPPFLLDTDYSRIGIGATLSQLDAAGVELPVAFASRALHGAEANYSTTDGELLATVWAITVRFRPYLYGGPIFTVRVDHNPLVWLHQQQALTDRLARWHIRLMEFNFVVVYRAGRAHSNADPLSRNPVATLPWEVEADELDLPEYAAPPLINTINQPALPSVRMVLSVRDVALGEGIGAHYDLEQEATSAGTADSQELEGEILELRMETPDADYGSPNVPLDEPHYNPYLGRVESWAIAEAAPERRSRSVTGLLPRDLFGARQSEREQPADEERAQYSEIELSESTESDGYQTADDEDWAPEGADTYKAAHGANHQCPTVRMIRAKTVEEQSADEQARAELLDRDWDEHIGWSPAEIVEAAQMPAPKE